MFGFFKATLTPEQEEIIKTHLPTLYRRHKQIMIKDAYGVLPRKCNQRWYKEKQHFIMNVVKLSRGNGKQFDCISDAIDEKIEEYESSQEAMGGSIHGPNDYEFACSQLLGKAGWKTSLTKATGDQGADIIAEKSTMKMVVQCKFYSKAVGNKAVQEVVAAKQFFGADLALVVAPNGFTRAAQELASVNRVYLRHHAELSLFDETVAPTAAW